MQPRTAVNSNIDVSRDRRFWVAALVLVVLQLLAFWMLCSYQVRKAELREAAARMERLAVADCLRYSPGATRDGCAARIAPLDRDATALAQDAPGAAAATLSSPVPVNYVYQR